MNKKSRQQYQTRHVKKRAHQGNSRNNTSPPLYTTTPAHHYIQQHQPTTTYNNTSPPLHTTTPAHHYIQQHQSTTTYNNPSPPLHTTTENQVVWTSDTHDHQPTGPPGMQHQDGRLQSERETKNNLDCRCQRDNENIQHPSSPDILACCWSSPSSPRDTPWYKRTDKVK